MNKHKTIFAGPPADAVAQGSEGGGGGALRPAFMSPGPRLGIDVWRPIRARTHEAFSSEISATHSEERFLEKPGIAAPPGVFEKSSRIEVEADKLAMTLFRTMVVALGKRSEGNEKNRKTAT